MKASHLSVRERYLLSLWQQYLDTDRLHQLDRFLAGAIRNIKNAGKKDRLWYGDHLFAMMRFAWLAVILDEADKQSIHHADELARYIDSIIPLNTSDEALARIKQVRPERLWHYVAQRLDIHEAGTSFKILRTLARSGDHLSAQLVWNGIAPFWRAAIETRSQLSGWNRAQQSTFLSHHASRPPIYLRVKEAHKAVVLEELTKVGLTVSETEGIVAITGQKGLFELDTYKAGLFDIQDFASQHIGLHVNATPGDLGWDACAGGGGKTLQLAAAMNGRGAVYASDIREHKLEEIKRRAKREELHNIRTFVWQGTALDRLPRDVGKRGGFDWVLVDAPCTSTGTWRRNPDARWRCDLQSLNTMTDLQSSLLSHAAAGVRPGGHLIYSTCSFLADENENVVNSFLQKHPDFTLIGMGMHGNPAVDADTMFSARLHKTSE